MTEPVPDLVPRRRTRLLAFCSRKLLKWFGWQVIGALPNRQQFIIAVAPHTSNWDFFLGLAVMFRLQLNVKFLGKHSIFIWPIKSLLVRFGGIPVERSHHHGVVGQMVDLFNQKIPLVLALAPEGTRSKVYKWKTGFLHIAHQANIPVVPIAFDFAKKTVEIMPARSISNNIEQERVAFQQLFTQVCAKNPHLA
ncbi:1-acyl-sn-glycerol-3-phosphate acyltransferase [Thalassotalea ganghwensis]